MIYINAKYLLEAAIENELIPVAKEELTAKNEFGDPAVVPAGTPLVYKNHKVYGEVLTAVPKEELIQELMRDKEGQRALAKNLFDMQKLPKFMDESNFEGELADPYFLNKIKKYGTDQLFVNDHKYTFELDVKPTGENEAWVEAHIWDEGEKTGSEYKHCIDGTEPSGYYMMYEDEDGFMQTAPDEFVPYEISFEEPDWERKLLEQMAQFVDQTKERNKELDDMEKE